MISLVNLKKEYNMETIIALKDYEFKEGTSYCILGPSGSGKSTLLNIIAGIVRPTNGDVLINGENITIMSEQKLDSFRYENIGYISQDFKLIEEFSTLDNLNLVGVGGKLTFKPEEVLAWVGLVHRVKAKVKTLSGGEKQRVAIARSLMKAPKVMLCDEPTGSLNTSIAIEIMKLIVNLHKEQGNVLITVTHDDRMSVFFDEVIKFEDLVISAELAGGDCNV